MLRGSKSTKRSSQIFLDDIQLFCFASSFCELEIKLNMSSDNLGSSRKSPQTRKRRTCGYCGSEGHDRRKCQYLQTDRSEEPSNLHTESQNTDENKQDDNEPLPTMVRNVSQVNLEHVLYVVFDLETTGFSKESHHIIEIAAQILAPNGAPIDNAAFQSYARPPTTIPAAITELTGISNQDVTNAPNFSEVAINFMYFKSYNLPATKQHTNL